MRPVLLLLVVLALPGCPEERAAPGKATAPVSTRTGPAGEEQLDQDGDGRIDTWRVHEPDGVVVETRDTDGDGKPDQTKRLEPLEDLPPDLEGLDVEALPGPPGEKKGGER